MSNQDPKDIEIDKWKNAWLKQRAATGKVAWEVPNPMYFLNSTCPYFQEQLRKFKEYAKMLEDYENIKQTNV
jgi:hypothetical protein